MNEIYAQTYLVPAEALDRAGLSASQSQPAVWDFPVGQTGHLASAVMDEGIVSVRSVLPEMPEQARADVCGAYTRMLQWNSQLPGTARFLLGNPDSLCVEAEAWLPQQDHAVDSVIAAVRGVQQGWKLFESWVEPGSLEVAGPAGDAAAAAPADLRELEVWAGRAGWACRARENGSLAFDLETGTRWHQCALVSAAGGPVRLLLELAKVDALPPICRRALALFLLRLNGLVFPARAVLTRHADETVACLEVAWPARPAPEELAIGLECLTAAGREYGDDLEPIFSAAVAESYLELGMGRT